MMYCKLFNKYINDRECDLCDSRSGYEKETWKDTCDHNRLLRHPILDSVKWWLRIDAFKFKFLICIARIANLFNPKKTWFVHSDWRGWHVGNLTNFTLFIDSLDRKMTGEKTD